MRKRIKYGDKNIIGKKVRELRLEKKIKQKDFLAQMQTEEIDINPSSLSKLEGQHRNASDKEVKVISRLLGVSADFLLETDKL